MRARGEEVVGRREVGMVAAKDALAQGLRVDALRNAVQDRGVERGATLGLSGQLRESPTGDGLAADPRVVGDLAETRRGSGVKNYTLYIKLRRLEQDS